MENENEVAAQTGTEETENDTEEEVDTDSEANDEAKEEVDSEKEELKKKLATSEAQKDHWRKKAGKKEIKVETPGTLSTKDLFALTKSDVHEDDIDDIVEYAKFKNVSVAEALKLGVVKTILADKKETRKTAQATNTGAGRVGAKKVTAEAVMDKFSKGDIPAKGSDEAEKLFWARRGRSGKPE